MIYATLRGIVTTVLNSTIRHRSARPSAFDESLAKDVGVPGHELDSGIPLLWGSSDLGFFWQQDNPLPLMEISYMFQRAHANKTLNYQYALIGLASDSHEEEALDPNCTSDIAAHAKRHAWYTESRAQPLEVLYPTGLQDNILENKPS
jgi:hypothetical protein